MRLLFFGVVLIVSAVALFLLQRWITPPLSAEMAGWCCPRFGSACVGKTDPMRCGDNGGFAFARDEELCTVACASSPPSHASPARSPR